MGILYHTYTCFYVIHIMMCLPVGEGPWGLVVCPSRELASQTTDVVEFFANALNQGGYPKLRSLCMIGGISVMEQVRAGAGTVEVAFENSTRCCCSCGDFGDFA